MDTNTNRCPKCKKELIQKLAPLKEGGFVYEETCECGFKVTRHPSWKEIQEWT